MTDSRIAKAWKYEHGDDSVERLSGRWGSMYIQARTVEPSCYACKVCGAHFRRDGMARAHAVGEHGTREKLLALSDELGCDAESRIDRFERVMNELSMAERAELLVEAKRGEPETLQADSYTANVF